MYLYKIGYYSYEDSGYVELSNEKKFSKKEFETFFINATVDLLIERRKEHYWLFEEEGEISDDERNFLLEQLKNYPERLKDSECKTEEEYIQKHGTRDYTHFSEIYNEVAQLMIENYGFQKVVYERIVDVDGWGGIVDQNRCFGKNEFILNKISKEYWKKKGQKK